MINFNDDRIGIDDINHFKEFGWVNINLNLSNQTIESALKDLKEMRRNAIKSNYPYGRVYFDHIHDFNLASIELPFNKSICPNSIKTFFSEAKIGSIIKDFFRWESPTCVLSRLFCMGNYNYRGNWHRDDSVNNIFDYGSSLEKLNIIQVGIYLENQIGFRILKKDFEYGNKNEIIDYDIEQLNSLNQFPLQPDSSSYFKVGGNAGSILLFDPSIYHQGSNKNARFDFHMRFQKEFKGLSKENNFQDFKVTEHLHEDFDINNLILNIPKINRQKLGDRLLNSLNYFFPFYNFYNILRRKESYKKLSKFGKPDIFSNTLYQKEK